MRGAVPTRRQFLTLAAIGGGAGFGWFISANSNEVGHTYVDMTDVPSDWLDDGRVLFRFDDGYYWLDREAMAFEPAEVEL